jgi:P-type Ca2+ transporter type 2C
MVTARSIAQQCGIYTPEGITLEGPDFRELSPDSLKAIVPQLQILARSEPEDKQLLVETFKELGEVVGFAGDGSNDGLALKAAHVGLTGIAGDDVAKEASDIILTDDNCLSIVKIIAWGRCLNDSVRKFLQFQISAQVAVAATTLASSFLPSPMLSVDELLWFLVVVDVFVAFSLAMDLLVATPALFKHKPQRGAEWWRTDKPNGQGYAKIWPILVHLVYQSATILLFYFFVFQIFGCKHDDPASQHSPEYAVHALFFGTFVFTLVFNSLNGRRLQIV